MVSECPGVLSEASSAMSIWKAGTSSTLALGGASAIVNWGTWQSDLQTSIRGKVASNLPKHHNFFLTPNSNPSPNIAFSKTR